MSVATGNKGEKAKKFQSLNINNIYQVSVIFMKVVAELRMPESKNLKASHRIIIDEL